MRILRVVYDYWPCVGGNERWNTQFDQWFSEVAGDQVQVLVLRHEQIFEQPGYRELLAGFRFAGDFQVPHLPKVRASQEILPVSRGVSFARRLRRSIRPWAIQPFDVIVTQISNFHSYFAWMGRPVSLEPTSTLNCSHEKVLECRRTPHFCRDCFREKGLGWLIRDQLNYLLLRRFDTIVAIHSILSELRRMNLESRAFPMRHIIDPSTMSRRPEGPDVPRLRNRIDELRKSFEILLFHFNRFNDFHNTVHLLELAKHLPEAAFVLAGDGPARPEVERRLAADPDLARRFVLLGPIDANTLGWYARGASAFVFTSLASNAGTSMYECMSVGVAPVVAIDTGDFLPEFQESELIVKTPAEPEAMAERVRATADNPDRNRRMVSAALRYVENCHSTDQMWRYRERLQQIARKRASKSVPA